jgi:hypothetical protein
MEFPMLPDEPETGHKKPHTNIEKREGPSRHEQERRHPGRDHAYDEKPKRSEDRPQKKRDD